MKKFMAFIIIIAAGLWFYPGQKDMVEIAPKESFTYIKKGNQLVWRKPAQDNQEEKTDQEETNNSDPTPDLGLAQKLAQHFSHYLQDGALVSMQEISNDKTPKKMQDYLVAIHIPNGEKGEFKARVEKASGEILITWDRSTNQRGVLPQRWKKAGYVLSFPQ